MCVGEGFTVTSEFSKLNHTVSLLLCMVPFSKVTFGVFLPIITLEVFPVDSGRDLLDSLELNRC